MSMPGPGAFRDRKKNTGCPFTNQGGMRMKMRSKFPGQRTRKHNKKPNQHHKPNPKNKNPSAKPVVPREMQTR